MRERELGQAREHENERQLKAHMDKRDIPLKLFRARKGLESAFASLRETLDRGGRGQRRETPADGPQPACYGRPGKWPLENGC